MWRREESRSHHGEVTSDLGLDKDFIMRGSGQRLRSVWGRNDMAGEDKIPGCNRSLLRGRGCHPSAGDCLTVELATLSWVKDSGLLRVVGDTQVIKRRRAGSSWEAASHSLYFSKSGDGKGFPNFGQGEPRLEPNLDTSSGALLCGESLPRFALPRNHFSWFCLPQGSS